MKKFLIYFVLFSVVSSLIFLFILFRTTGFTPLDIIDMLRLRSATEKQDLSACSKIRGEEARNACYINIAISEKDASICEKIEIVEWQDDCYDLVEKHSLEQ